MTRNQGIPVLQGGEDVKWVCLDDGMEYWRHALGGWMVLALLASSGLARIGAPSSGSGELDPSPHS